MRKVLLVVAAPVLIPHLFAFLIVTGIAFVIGKIPMRINKLALLPWLDFLCGFLTLFGCVGLLHLVGVREPTAVLMAGAAWLVFYVSRGQPLPELCRAMAGFFTGWGLYRFG
jgi:hypothetical protein